MRSLKKIKQTKVQLVILIKKKKEKERSLMIQTIKMKSQKKFDQTKMQLMIKMTNKKEEKQNIMTPTICQEMLVENHYILMRKTTNEWKKPRNTFTNNVRR